MDGNNKASFNVNVPMFIEETGISFPTCFARTKVYTVDFLLKNFKENNK
jgi:hypothetical protein